MFAQSGGNYSISWSTLGGGGTSAGGGFAVSATIGQPNAGAPMTGGGFTLTGGFWPGVPAEPGPKLSIRHGSGSTVVLFWPNPSAGYVLEQTANMSGPGGGWSNVTQTPSVNGGNKEVTVPITGQACLFRLRRL